ncbi:MAG: hypothetical protein J1E42_01770 [Akkermansiaceae bacterium]|nr:hypothetical protein [Akkermansiaceae bacterium]
MKITSYIPPVLAAGLMVFGYQYAATQTKTTRMLVDARVGLGSEPSGMTLTNSELDSQAANVARKRAEAVKANEQALVLARKAQEDLDAAKYALDENKVKLEEIRNRVEEAKRRFKEQEEENDRIVAAIHSVPLLADTAPEDAASKLEEHVKDFNTQYDDTKTQLSAKENERVSLTSEVAGLEVDLTNKLEINERFMDAYRKNGEEFTVDAVDPQWHFVVFKAGENSGLYAGDPARLLVQRNGVAITTLRVVSVSGGQVVAEYDESTLPRGVRIQIGDRIFRQKPLGL